MITNAIVTRFEILHILMNLIETTGKNNFQMFFNSLLGISPEMIDKNILCERRRNKELEI